jgi:tRNA (guanine-N7-)-methyltransferase
MSQPPDPAAYRNFYGRRHGKTLRPNQRTHLAEDLGPLSPGPVSRADNPGRQPLDLAPFAGRELWLEVGFGGGEHMVAQAAANPRAVILGCEPFINGVAMLLGKIREAGVSNLRVYPGDARDLLELLPPAALSRAFLLYPDPWPKRRHHRRRFVTQGHLAPLARALAPGAEFRVATDIPDYARQAREEVPAAGFAPVSDGATAWPDWTSTRYEKKALREGRAPAYLTWRRL